MSNQECHGHLESRPMRLSSRASIGLPSIGMASRWLRTAHATRSVVGSAHIHRRYASTGKTMYDKLEMCMRLEKYDPWTGSYIAESCQALRREHGELAEKLPSLFSELFAAKDLCAMHLERRISLTTQAVLARDAAEHLTSTMEALDEQVNTQGSAPQGLAGGPLAALEALGYGPARLNPRVAAQLTARMGLQVKAAVEERDAANVLLASIEPTAGPKRLIEVVTAAKQADIERELLSVIAQLRSASAAGHAQEVEEMEEQRVAMAA